MGKCDVCGKEVALPFKCAFCGGFYCSDHRLPESHNCNQLIQAGKRRVVYRGTDVPTSDDKVSAIIKATKKSSSSMKVILLILLIGSSALNLYLWNFRYSEGFEVGYSEGSMAGFKQGQAIGYQQGYEKGNDTGYFSGHKKGYDKGKKLGYQYGYDYGYAEGNNIGFDRGNETGYAFGYDKGTFIGYEEGYLQGIEDGSGRGYTIRDPTYKEVKQFIRTDKTDSMKYDPQNFVCHDFSAMFKTNAFNAGFRCFYVSIRYPDSSHAIVGFNTTDKGFIFIEPQHDDIVTVEIGNLYVDRSKYVAPDYDDTIVDYTLIP